MLKKLLPIKLRHAIKRIPGARALHLNSRLAFSPTYREDGLCSAHNADFTKEPVFVKSYQAALAMDASIDLRWRSHVAQWAGYQASLLEGDFVECGVNRAFLSTAVMQAIDFEKLTHRNFYLIDTYCGLVPELLSDKDTAAHYNEYTDVYDFVKNAFAKQDNVHVVKGVVPDVLAEVDIERVAYLSIDMNCSIPERAALEHFWPKMVPGGLILLDDYGWKGHEEQKRCSDEFARSVGARILSMPTGQGLLVKHDQLELEQTAHGSGQFDLQRISSAIL
jgi:hypothetical protein